MAIARHNVDLYFRVLMFVEHGEYVAHALELDLIGTGSSPNKAIADLRSAIEAQVTFALQKQDPGLLDFPAPAETFARWEDAHRRNLRDFGEGDVPMKGRCEAMMIEIPAAELASLRKAAAGHVFSRQSRPAVCA